MTYDIDDMRFRGCFDCSLIDQISSMTHQMFVAVERDPTKRRIKPGPSSALLDFDVSGESSDDSDFRIEDHCEESDDDDSIDSDENKNDDDSDYEEGSDDSEDDNKMTVEELLQQAEAQKQKCGGMDPIKIMICCVCLGDRSDANNEIVECDGCGVTVHEGCYGVSENDSVSSTVSSCSTMPWFCEACRAGVDNPACELCPNSGGIFKETDTGKWVHLVCALYIPGVAFGEVDKLSAVTLFEMSYSKWGARSCSLCLDQRFIRTGVCIGCDAGLCRTYFHVTCGQREGLLSEAHSEEVDQADPFYAHCKLHSDKALLKKRRRNWLALELRTAQRKKQYAAEGHSDLPEQLRIRRKLDKYRGKYASVKANRPPPWVPTQKMARPLTSSASLCQALWRKAALSGMDTSAWVLKEAHSAALTDIHRKWHIAPAFSVEFVGYYLDRNNRIESMKQQLAVLLEENSKLVEEQQDLQARYDQALKENSVETAQHSQLKSTLQTYHDVILKVAPNKKLPDLNYVERPVLKSHHPLERVDVYEFRESSDEDSLGFMDFLIDEFQESSDLSTAITTGSVPTPAALKAGVGFPLGLKRQSLNQREPPMPYLPCGICRLATDQHLLAKCDTCHLHYHLGCLNPPLTRMPKKTKLMGWLFGGSGPDSDLRCEDTEEIDVDDIVPEPDTVAIAPILVDSDDYGRLPPYHSCAAHTLNMLATTDTEAALCDPAYKKIQRLAFAKCQAIFNKQNKSALAADIVKKHLGRYFLVPGATRWNCQFDAIELLIKKENKLDSLCKDLDLPSFKRPQEIQFLAEYCKVMEPIAQGLDFLQGEKEIYMGFLLPTLTVVKSALSSLAELQWCEPLKQALLKGFEKRQCSECDKDSSGSDMECLDPEAPRQLRKLKDNGNGDITPPAKSADHSEAEKEKENHENTIEALENALCSPGVGDPSPAVSGGRLGKKRRREKHHRYSPEPGTSVTPRPHKRKRKRKSMETPEAETEQNRPALKIFFKSIPHPTGEGSAYAVTPGGVYQASISSISRPPPAPAVTAVATAPPPAKKHKEADAILVCDTCNTTGTNANIVRCDECLKGFHFHCLDPPVKKSPKVRGYSWHCAGCDPTESDSA